MHFNAGMMFIEEYVCLGNLKVLFNALGLANTISFQEFQQHNTTLYGTKSSAGNFIGDVIFKKTRWASLTTTLQKLAELSVFLQP